MHHQSIARQQTSRKQVSLRADAQEGNRQAGKHARPRGGREFIEAVTAMVCWLLSIRTSEPAFDVGYEQTRNCQCLCRASFPRARAALSVLEGRNEQKPYASTGTAAGGVARHPLMFFSALMMPFHSSHWVPWDADGNQINCREPRTWYVGYILIFKDKINSLVIRTGM